MNATTAHISNVSKSCWGHLRSLEKLGLFLANAIAVSLIMSRLDYCSSALCGLPANQLNRPQRIQDAAARIVIRRNSRDRKCYPSSAVSAPVAQTGRIQDRLSHTNAYIKLPHSICRNMLTRKIYSVLFATLPFAD